MTPSPRASQALGTPNSRPFNDFSAAKSIATPGAKTHHPAPDAITAYRVAVLTLPSLTAQAETTKVLGVTIINGPPRHILRRDKLSHAVRLERYRLVIAANDILCDPGKRRAYDLYGAGWAGKLGMENNMREADRAWRKQPGNASMNATWEDWERWYEERNGEKRKQSPLYMSNELFVAVLCAIAIFGSMGQARRASTQSMNLIEMRDQKHEAISHDMRQRQGELASLDRQERVENFLRQREGWALASSMSNQTEPPHHNR
ncbi:hypothetical protein DL765_008841 [Monosporascus sp. GIB2]|nr:hypothetical protein DL765_008841 [Monosporascus sp. GIB2]